MNAPPDHYEVYYADKLWSLLPAVYRALDTDQFGANGPLREMVNRIGAQAAILRRSIDRMWEDQSIETCDDWLIPYIGELLGDEPGFWPRRARPAARRRQDHLLPPPQGYARHPRGDRRQHHRMGREGSGILPPARPHASRPRSADRRWQAQGPMSPRCELAEGLVGRLTATGIGGLADLRNVYGATKAHSAFDEFFHTADFRQGRRPVWLVWNSAPWRVSLALAEPPCRSGRRRCQCRDAQAGLRLIPPDATRRCSGRHGPPTPLATPGSPRLRPSYRRRSARPCSTTISTPHPAYSIRRRCRWHSSLARRRKSMC